MKSKANLYSMGKKNIIYISNKLWFFCGYSDNLENRIASITASPGHNLLSQTTVFTLGILFMTELDYPIAL